MSHCVAGVSAVYSFGGAAPLKPLRDDSALTLFLRSCRPKVGGTATEIATNCRAIPPRPELYATHCLYMSTKLHI